SLARHGHRLLLARARPRGAARRARARGDVGFLEHVPDRQRAEALAGPVAAQLPDAEWYLADADAEGYGLTPLVFAPTPDSRWRPLFDDAQIEAHLDRLEREPPTDGGWPVTGEPPSEASRLEWRGIVTLGALRTLTAYGRLR